MYGWDGDQLAWESRQESEAGVGEHFQVIAGAARTTHYLYEPGSFVPLAQAVRRKAITLPVQPAYAEDYDLDEDPLWTQAIEPQAFDAIAWYQCDHLGTPQELTDEAGEIAWSVQYKAWGAAQEVITDAAHKAGIHNPLRFQGQYYDHETGLHYNRHRYYDPVSGRFVSKDPIGLAGGINVYQYAPNPVGWVDPLGLAKCRPCPADCAKILSQAGREYGRHDEVSKDSHHIIQNAAVKGISDYDENAAPAIQLSGPSSKVGSEHYIATQSQRQKGVGGTYAAERMVAYRAMRRAGLSTEEARCHIMHSDSYFSSLGVGGSTVTRMPGNRNSSTRRW
jgi:RHS repeat-associated protein